MIPSSAEAFPMTDRPITRSPRPGRHSRCTDLGRKTRCFPTGSARLRLRQVLHPPTFDDHVVVWLGLRLPSTLACISISTSQPNRTPSLPASALHDPPPDSPQNLIKTPPELAEVMVAWASLPEAIRIGILAIVRASSVPEHGR